MRKTIKLYSLGGKDQSHLASINGLITDENRTELLNWYISKVASSQIGLCMNSNLSTGVHTKHILFTSLTKNKMGIDKK